MPSRRSIFVIGALMFLALSILGNLDATLRQMHEPGAVSGGVTDIASPLTSTREANDLRKSWRAWDDYLNARSDTDSRVKNGREVLAHPGTIVAIWLAVDSFLFAPLLWWFLRRIATRRACIGGRWWRWLVVVPAFAAAYLSCDEIENVLTARFIFHPGQSHLLLKLASAGKVLFFVAAAAPVALSLVLPGATEETDTVKLRNLAVRLRIPMAMAGAVGVVFLLLPGSVRPQIADVVRSWSPNDHLSAFAWASAFILVLMVCIWMAGAIAIAVTRTSAPPRPVNWTYKGLQIAAILGIVAVTLSLRAADLDIASQLGFLLAGGWFVNVVLTFATVEVFPRPADFSDARRALAVFVSAPALFLAALVLRSAQLSNFDSATRLIVGAAVIALIVFFVVVFLLPNRELPSARTAIVVLSGIGVVAVGFAVWLVSSIVDNSWKLGAVAVVLLMLIIATVGLGLLGLIRRPPRGVFSLIGMHRPPIICAVLGAFLLTGAFDKDIGYHKARLLPQARDDSATRHATDLGAAIDAFGNDPPPAIEAPDKPKVVPLFVLASSGGGARAAYWTLLAVNCLFGGQSPPNLKQPLSECKTGSWDHVFLASGSSGGSVGLAMYAAQHADGQAVVPADHVFRDGDVDPIMAGMLFGDLPNAVLTHDTWPDRAARLEEAWEAKLPSLKRGFYATQLAEGAGDDPGVPTLPVLLLNSTAVEDGCRINVSVLDLVDESDGRNGTATTCRSLERFKRPLLPRQSNPLQPLSSTRDIDDFVCGDIRLSTAALLSARFPFVSPTGAMKACPNSNARSGQHTFAVDGGYIDASGAGAVVELLDTAVGELQAKFGSNTCVQPVVLQLDNGYDELTKTREPGRPREFLAPILGVGVASAGRSEASKQQLAIEATRPRCDVGDRETYLHVYPRARPGVEAPLGWSLSSAARTDMQDQMASSRNVAALCNAQRWLAGSDRKCAEVAPAPAPFADKASLPGHAWLWLLLMLALVVVLAIAIPYLWFFYEALL